MISDDERREVARRLREMGEELGSSVLLWYYIAKILGVRTATDGKTACGMLADLIEPPLQCPHYHSDIHYCSIREDIQPIDRGALLALADEFDEQAETIARYIESSDGDFDRHAIDAMEEQCGYARRIREALGVDDA